MLRGVHQFSRNASGFPQTHPVSASRRRQAFSHPIKQLMWHVQRRTQNTDIYLRLIVSVAETVLHKLRQVINILSTKKDKYDILTTTKFESCQ